MACTKWGGDIGEGGPLIHPLVVCSGKPIITTITSVWRGGEGRGGFGAKGGLSNSYLKPLDATAQGNVLTFKQHLATPCICHIRLCVDLLLLHISVCICWIWFARLLYVLKLIFRT